MLETEKELLKGILKYKDITQEYLPYLNHNYFSFFPAKVIIWAINSFKRKYDTFPQSSSDLKLFILEHEKEIEFSEDELKRKKEWEQLEYFLKILDNEQEYSIPSEETFKENLLKFIKRQRLTRNLSILKKAVLKGIGIENALDRLKQEVEVVKEDFDKGLSINEFLSIEKPVRYGVVPTGIDTLDSYMDGGLARKELGMIAASSGIGKTSVMCNFAFTAAFLETPVIYITLEMSPEQIFLKFISMFTNIPTKEFKDRKIMEVLLEKEVNIEDLKESLKCITIKYFPPGSNIFEIGRYLVKMKKYEKFDGIVFVDYLNEITYPRISEYWLQMGKITSAFDKLATELELPIWIAAQASAKAESKKQFNIKDLYGAKVEAVKKLSFGIGLTRKVENDKQRVRATFFKNRLYGTATPPVELEYDIISGKITEYGGSGIVDSLDIGFDTPNKKEGSKLKSEIDEFSDWEV